MTAAGLHANIKADPLTEDHLPGSDQQPCARARGQAFLARARARLSAFDPYDLAVAVLLTVLVVLVFATYRDYAVSNDEPMQQRYGELIVAYYGSGFTDRSLFHYHNLYLFGGLFDVLAVLVERLVPSINAFDLRHILCALIGIAGIFGTYAAARLVAGTRAGAIAAFVLAVCGPWYGSMFNHTKDIPFATAMIGATYFLLRASRDLPRPRWRDVAGFGLLLGAALGMRVLGLLMIGYAGLALLIHIPRLREDPAHDQVALFAQSVIAFLPAFVIGYVIMIAAWPWSALAPLNPIRGLINLGEFNTQLQTLLAGHVYISAEVPRWYVPAYLLIKLPLLILAGAVVALASTLWPGESNSRGAGRRLETALLVFIAVFPVICEVVKRGSADAGLRHFLFVVPVFAVLAGIGFDWLLRELAAWRRLVAAGAAALLGALVWNAGVLVRLHPYQNLYFNTLVGGLQGASRRYVTDYWTNIMPEAVDELEAYIARHVSADPDHRYKVAVCGERLPFEKEAGPRLEWTKDWKKADFFIAPTHMNCDRALDGKVIATIARLGAQIGVVKDRRALVLPGTNNGAH